MKWIEVRTWSKAGKMRIDTGAGESLVTPPGAFDVVINDKPATIEVTQVNNQWVFRIEAEDLEPAAKSDEVVGAVKEYVLANLTRLIALHASNPHWAKAQENKMVELAKAMSPKTQDIARKAATFDQTTTALRLSKGLSPLPTHDLDSYIKTLIEEAAVR